MTSIGDSAFENCLNLTEFYIPSTVVSIGRQIFAGCYKLDDLRVADDNAKYDSRDNNKSNSQKTK